MNKDDRFLNLTKASKEKLISVKVLDAVEDAGFALSLTKQLFRNLESLSNEDKLWLADKLSCLSKGSQELGIYTEKQFKDAVFSGKFMSLILTLDNWTTERYSSIEDLLSSRDVCPELQQQTLRDWPIRMGGVLKDVLTLDLEEVVVKESLFCSVMTDSKLVTF